MTWTPLHLTREQMEERRLKGAQLLKAGKLSQAEIARRLGVSRTAVTHWAHQLDSAQPLQLRVAPGRPPKLTAAQQRTLKRLLKRGARAAGFPTERWTLRRIQQVIEREFGVAYHEHSLSDVLAGLGWSLQQPLARAQERDKDIIQAWLAQDWSRIKKGATTWRRHRVFR
jgi:putative transposase